MIPLIEFTKYKHCVKHNFNERMMGNCFSFPLYHNSKLEVLIDICLRIFSIPRMACRGGREMNQIRRIEKTN